MAVAPVNGAAAGAQDIAPPPRTQPQPAQEPAPRPDPVIQPEQQYAPEPRDDIRKQPPPENRPTESGKGQVVDLIG